MTDKALVGVLNQRFLQGRRSRVHEAGTHRVAERSCLPALRQHGSDAPASGQGDAARPPQMLCLPQAEPGDRRHRLESSHIEVHVWLQAAYLLCSSKKGISSNQLARTLGVTVKTGAFISHRLREAMTAGTLPSLGGIGVKVEVDETFIGNKKKDQPVRRGFVHKHAVMTLVRRGGFSILTVPVPQTAADHQEASRARHARDEAGQYAHLNEHFAKHEVVRQGAGEYVRGDAHTNTAESFYSVFNRWD